MSSANDQINSKHLKQEIGNKTYPKIFYYYF